MKKDNKDRIPRTHTTTARLTTSDKLRNYLNAHRLSTGDFAYICGISEYNARRYCNGVLSLSDEQYNAFTRTIEEYLFFMKQERKSF